MSSSASGMSDPHGFARAASNADNNPYSVRPPKATSPTIQAAPIYTYAPDEALLSLTSAHPTLLKRFGSTSNVTKSLSEDYDFRFDLLHVHPLPTEHLYDRKIKPVVKAALGGFNGTVFAWVHTVITMSYGAI